MNQFYFDGSNKVIRSQDIENDPDGEEEFEETLIENDNDNNNDHAPDMPEEFYSNVNNFLNRPPPLLHNSSTLSAAKEDLNLNFRRDAKVTRLPNITYKNQINTISGNERKGAAAAGIVKNYLDERLLKEAFDYANQLLSMDQSEYESQMEKSERNNKSNKSSKSEQLANPYYKEVQQNLNNQKDKGMVEKLRTRTKIKNNSSSKINKIQRSKSAVQSHEIIQEFDLTVEKEEISNKKSNPIDYDELVNNLQNGVLLQKLKQDLQQSKQSMAKSEKFFRDLSKDFINNMNNKKDIR